MTEQYETFWLIDGQRYDSEHAVEQKVMDGAIAIEVSALQQQMAAERRQIIKQLEAAVAEKLQREAARREHEQSPEGKAQAARRTALENPGGIVSGGISPLAELDEYSPTKTNLLR